MTSNLKVFLPTCKISLDGIFDTGSSELASSWQVCTTSSVSATTTCKGKHSVYNGNGSSLVSFELLCKFNGSVESWSCKFKGSLFWIKLLQIFDNSSKLHLGEDLANSFCKHNGPDCNTDGFVPTTRLSPSTSIVSGTEVTGNGSTSWIPWFVDSDEYSVVSHFTDGGIILKGNCDLMLFGSKTEPAKVERSSSEWRIFSWKKSNYLISKIYNFFFIIDLIFGIQVCPLPLSGYYLDAP